MLELLVIVYIFYIGMKILLNYLEIKNTYKYQDKKAVILSSENYQKAAKYKVANEKFAIWSNVWDLLIALFWISAGLSWLEGFIGAKGSIYNDILFVDTFIAINYILSLPFDLYNTFIKDKRFGFSTIDAKTYVQDQIKGAVLFLVFGSLVVFVVGWIINSLPLWWVWSFVVIMAILVAINLIYPTFIAPIFNKFKPLEDEDLKESIGKLLAKAGLNSDGVFTIDASKRDNRLNAFFGGLGKSKRVVLYDTLLEKVDKGELLAILGHELGHFTHKDIIKKIALMGAMMFVIFAIFGNIPSSIYEALSVDSSSSMIITFFLLFSPVLFFVLMPISSAFSRANEYGADEYGSECESKEALSSALMKLADENKSFPYSNKLNIIFYHTHPPLVERLRALGVDFSDHQ